MEESGFRIIASPHLGTFAAANVVTAILISCGALSDGSNRQREVKHRTSTKLAGVTHRAAV